MVRVAMRGDSYLGNMRTEPGQIYHSIDDDVGFGGTYWRIGLIIAMQRSRGRRVWPLISSFR